MISSNEDDRKNDAAGISRRSFVRQASLTGSLAFPTIVPSSVFGANAPSERVNLAAFGVGGRGTAVNGAFARFPDGRYVAVCDAYRSRRERAKKAWDGIYGGDYVKTYSNPFEVLKRDDVDAVVIYDLRSLARSDGHRRSQGQEGHVRREAAELRHGLVSEAARGTETLRRHFPVRHAAAFRHAAGARPHFGRRANWFETATSARYSEWTYGVMTCRSSSRPSTASNGAPCARSRRPRISISTSGAARLK